MKHLGTLAAVFVFFLSTAAIPALAQDREEPKPEAPKTEAPKQEAPKQEAPKEGKPESHPENQAKPDQNQQMKDQTKEQEKQQKDQAKEEQKTQEDQKKQAEEQKRKDDDAKRAQKDQNKQKDQNREQARAAAPDNHNDNHAQRSSQRIPDEKFRASFGREHHFHVGHPVIVENRPRFQYSGYWFEFVDVWPTDWSYDDDCYIDYVDDGYYLFDPIHPGVRISLTVVL